MEDLSKELKKEADLRIKTKADLLIRGTRKEVIASLLLKLIKQNLNLFPRHVTKSEKETVIPHQMNKERCYFVMREIGMVGERRLFFREAGYLDLYKEKKGTRTDPPTVICLNAQLTTRLALQIVNFLDNAKLPKKDTAQIKVPPGFYVFEFRAIPGVHDCPHIRVTVEPFRAQNLKEAIKTFKLCPNYPDFRDFSDFSVYTSEGKQDLTFESEFCFGQV